jgi:hypothetical protein
MPVRIHGKDGSRKRRTVEAGVAGSTPKTGMSLQSDTTGRLSKATMQRSQEIIRS